MTLFRYPGGKSKLYSKIADKLSLCNGLEYREPFMGGGHVCTRFLANNPSINNIWINDIDVGLASLWTAVINQPILLKELVKNFEPSVKKFNRFKEDLLDINIDLHNLEILRIVEIGFRKLAVHQMSYSGLGTQSGPIGGKEQKSAYKVDCRWNPNKLCEKIDRLHKLFMRKMMTIRYNICTAFDFRQVIADETTRAFIYVDPPYYEKGNCLYQYKFSEKDHEDLMVMLHNTTHSWVLSYDDCTIIKNMYHWANIYEVDVNYTINGTRNNFGKRTGNEKRELLICSNEYKCAA